LLSRTGMVFRFDVSRDNLLLIINVLSLVGSIGKSVDELLEKVSFQMAFKGVSSG